MTNQTEQAAADQLQGGSYTINPSTHERELIEQTKPATESDATEPSAKVVKLAEVKTKTAKPAQINAQTQVEE